MDGGTDIFSGPSFLNNQGMAFNTMDGSAHG